MCEIEDVVGIGAWKSLWEDLSRAEAGHVLVFKRSPICPISHRAQRCFENFVKTSVFEEQMRIVSVDVIGARPVSLRIAEDTGVRHQSPQAILLGPGPRVLWHASHDSITQVSLGEAVQQALHRN